MYIRIYSIQRFMSIWRYVSIRRPNLVRRFNSIRQPTAAVVARDAMRATACQTLVTGHMSGHRSPAAGIPVAGKHVYNCRMHIQNPKITKILKLHKLKNMNYGTYTNYKITLLFFENYWFVRAVSKSSKVFCHVWCFCKRNCNF